MGANSIELSRQVTGACSAAKVIGCRDYNELTRIFVREFALRTQDGIGPDCLLIDIEEGGQYFRSTADLGKSSLNLKRNNIRCFTNGDCHAETTWSNDQDDCRVFAQLPLINSRHDPDLRNPTGIPARTASYDLVMCCHSLSFVANFRALCFLRQLRQAVRVGGLLFLSALGKYSALADSYPDEDAPLPTRFFPLGTTLPSALTEDTRVCLYSERELCTTLFKAGWSVIRSSTTTENNVLATAVRL